MNDIISRIIRNANLFEVNNGKKPTHVKLGKREIKELRNYANKYKITSDEDDLINNKITKVAGLKVETTNMPSELSTSFFV